MANGIPTDWEGFLKQIRSAVSLEELSALEHQIHGRKSGAMTLAMKDLQALDAKEKAERGKELNRVKRDLEELFEKRRSELEASMSTSLAETDRLDMTLELPPEERGHLHLIPEFIRTADNVFGRMGFDVAEGPEIDDEAHQFDLLNFPKDHAARDSQDIFYVADDKAPASNRLLLRGHTSTVQIRYMKEHKPPLRTICTGKVYRKDSDATHSPMFHQIEGLMVGKDISLANMKAVMETAVRELIDPNVEFRWRTGYFPFVEPGLEMDLRWRGDEAQSREGRWLEIVGCGMVHPNVLKNCGIDPKGWQGFAFGFGVERMIMIKHQIPDLRSFYTGDLRFLKQF